MLPHLGPEIIAVMQQARSSPNDSREGFRLPFPGKGEDKIIRAMVLSRPLGRSNARTVGVLNVWVCCAHELPYPDLAADLGWIGNLLAIIGVVTFRKGSNHVGRITRR